MQVKPPVLTHAQFTISGEELLGLLIDRLLQPLTTKVDIMLENVQNLVEVVQAHIAQVGGVNLPLETELKTKLEEARTALAAANANIATVTAQVTQLQTDLATAKAAAASPEVLTALDAAADALKALTQSAADSAVKNASAN